MNSSVFLQPIGLNRGNRTHATANYSGCGALHELSPDICRFESPEISNLLCANAWATFAIRCGVQVLPLLVVVGISKPPILMPLNAYHLATLTPHWL